ncbi:MAG: GntP family permease [Deltaproteobacteria bacterium]|jgi:H+/gluconate symporter-like permease|nr:GntP family permease [Deltaproteobacteria bacterium]
MVIGIIISLALLTYIAYKGYSVILFAPVCALLAAFTADVPLLPGYTELFMVKAVTYVKNFFPVFLLGAVFGKVMEESGAARSVSRYISNKLGPERAVLAVVLTAAVLTYGGISLFVVAFAVYPFGSALFLEANLPRRLLPGAIALGAFGFTMTAIPGTPQIQNIIPTVYFHTDAYAAPVFGLIGGLMIAVLGVLWLEYRKRKMLSKGETYGELDTRVSTNFDDGVPELPPMLAILPLLVVLVVNYILTQVMKGWEQSMMEGTAGLPLAAKVIPVANWALIVALIVGIVLAIIFAGKQFKARGNLQTALNAGAIGSLLAIMNTASEAGYGNVISSLPGFAAVRDFLLSIDPGTPLLSEALTVNVLAGVSGSASGGMSIALEAMGTRYLEWGMRVGLDPELLHRVAAMSSGGFDTMPHNGAVITLLAICGMTHKKSYPDIGMTTLVVPFVTTLVLILVWTVLGLGHIPIPAA